jgi:hypothetical protein
MCYDLGDLAPRGRNAQTLSEPEGSSNRDACNRRGIRILNFSQSSPTVDPHPTYRQAVLDRH